MVKKSVDKNGWLWLAPAYFNQWRLFPRAFIIFYFWLALETSMWFMSLPVPGPAQAAFASAVMGAGAAWFGLYVNSGPRTSYKNLDRTPHAVTIPHVHTPTPKPKPKPNPTPDSNTEVGDGIPEYKIRGK
jgi:hypothetical protein